MSGAVGQETRLCTSSAETRFRPSPPVRGGNINFVGAGNTFAVNGTTVDVSIEGGGGTKAGEAINYPSGTKSPFILNTVVISESITLGNSNSGTGAANIITGESMITVDDSVTITIEEGKKVIPDLFNVFDTPERFRN